MIFNAKTFTTGANEPIVNQLNLGEWRQKSTDYGSQPAVLFAAPTQMRMLRRSTSRFAT
jgi:hypothetical protein